MLVKYTWKINRYLKIEATFLNNPYQRGNHKRNQKIFWVGGKQKQNISKFVKWNKESFKKKCIIYMLTLEKKRSLKSVA